MKKFGQRRKLWGQFVKQHGLEIENESEHDDAGEACNRAPMKKCGQRRKLWMKFLIQQGFLSEDEIPTESTDELRKRNQLKMCKRKLWMEFLKQQQQSVPEGEDQESPAGETCTDGHMKGCGMRRKMWIQFLKAQGMRFPDDSAAMSEEICSEKRQRREKRHQMWMEFMQTQAADCQVPVENQPENPEEKQTDDKHVRFETPGDEMMTQPMRDFPQPCAPEMKASGEPELPFPASDMQTTSDESDGNDCSTQDAPVHQFAVARPNAFWHFQMMRRHRNALQHCIMAPSKHNGFNRRCHQRANPGRNPQMMKAWRQFKRQQMAANEQTDD